MLKKTKLKQDLLKNMMIKTGLYFALLFSCCLTSRLVFAENLASTFEAVNYLTVEQNIALMDKDNNGFADVFEVRAYLEKMHGEGYEKERLDFLVSTAKGKSCSTPFAKSLY